ncbi:EF-hand domain-containing protein [Mariniflexile sp. AS56]|uniref:EF-hand domain-containing protein n=1 Tax=Mariniflexile sp. AS56 TaxID=3063957 RepID=UPI0026ED1829|nr:EF-hand domain-containing protein [Mariniflexile sp. AS56]MDO7170667.1 EF-hand domain-containing protein [Mariniflexile sp. AS56]
MKRNKLSIALLVFGFTVIASTSAFAQSSNNKEKGKKPPTVEELFKQMDADEDGKLSLKEIKGPLKDDFKKIDTNEDGFLSKEELEKAPKPKGERPSNGKQ